VQQGDTLAGIASTFGIYTQDLQSVNTAVASGVLQVGTFVRLPPWASTCPDPDSDAPTCRVYTGGWVGGSWGLKVAWHCWSEQLLALLPSSVGRYMQVHSKPCAHPPRTAPDLTSGCVPSPVAVQSGDFVFGVASIFRVRWALGWPRSCLPGLGCCLP